VSAAGITRLGDTSVLFDDGSPEKFLRRLWRDLCGDEPIPSPGQC
jgi:hypothetical protein